MMSIIFKGVTGCLVFLDYIIVFADTREKYQLILEEVLHRVRIRAAGLKEGEIAVWEFVSEISWPCCICSARHTSRASLDNGRAVETLQLPGLFQPSPQWDIAGQMLLLTCLAGLLDCFLAHRRCLQAHYGFSSHTPWKNFTILDPTSTINTLPSLPNCRESRVKGRE